MRYGDGISWGELTTLPGCSQVAVSHGVTIHQDHRGKGLASVKSEDRFNLARKLGYDLLICTCDESNLPQVKTLLKTGWIKVYIFKSSRTENSVGLWMKSLEPL